MLDETGAAGVMIGRAAFGYPWIFRETRALLEHGAAVQPATPRERLETCMRQLRLLSEQVGEGVAVREMRKHVAWYVKGLPRSSAVRESANRMQSAEEVETLLADFLLRLETGAVEADEVTAEEAWSEPVGA